MSLLPLLGAGGAGGGFGGGGAAFTGGDNVVYITHTETPANATVNPEITWDNDDFDGTGSSLEDYPHLMGLCYIPVPDTFSAGSDIGYGLEVTTDGGTTWISTNFTGGFSNLPIVSSSTADGTGPGRRVSAWFIISGWRGSGTDAMDLCCRSLETNVQSAGTPDCGTKAGMWTGKGTASINGFRVVSNIITDGVGTDADEVFAFYLYGLGTTLTSDGGFFQPISDSALTANGNTDFDLTAGGFAGFDKFFAVIYGDKGDGTHVDLRVSVDAGVSYLSGAADYKDATNDSNNRIELNDNGTAAAGSYQAYFFLDRNVARNNVSANDTGQICGAVMQDNGAGSVVGHFVSGVLNSTFGEWDRVRVISPHASDALRITWYGIPSTGTPTTTDGGIDYVGEFTDNASGEGYLQVSTYNGAAYSPCFIAMHFHAPSTDNAYTYGRVSFDSATSPKSGASDYKNYHGIASSNTGNGSDNVMLAGSKASPDTNRHKISAGVFIGANRDFTNDDWVYFTQMFYASGVGASGVQEQNTGGGMANAAAISTDQGAGAGNSKVTRWWLGNASGDWGLGGASAGVFKVQNA